MNQKPLADMARDALKEGLTQQEFVDRMFALPLDNEGALAFACRSAYTRAEGESFTIHDRAIWFPGRAS